MKTLIVFYSFSGNNKVLARYLQQKTGADLQEIVELKRRTGFSILLDVLFKRTPRIAPPNILWSQYDRVFLLAPIWAGRIASPLKAFLQLEKKHIKNYFFISLCGNSGNKKIATELTQLVHQAPTAVLELAVNELLPPEKKNKIRYTSGYRVQTDDLPFFDPALENVVPVSQAV
jgi:flavodoxin